MHTVAIVGVGRVGGALALACARAGLSVTDLVHRSPSNARKIADAIEPPPRLTLTKARDPIAADVVIIATRDPDIREAAEFLAGRVNPGQVVLHTSGSLTSDELSSLAARSVETGSMHPLIAINDALTGAERVRGSYFCLEGSAKALETAAFVAAKLGARTFAVKDDVKALYHASAVMAAGHIVALFDAAAAMLSECGVERDTAAEILLPLAEGSLENLRDSKPERALTGPFARLDVQAVELHLELMAERCRPNVQSIYRELALRSLEIAARLSPDEEKVEQIRSRLFIAEESLR